MKSFWRNLSLFLIPLVFLGAGCSGSSQAQQLATKPVVLKIWSVFDDEKALKELMSAYQATHPNVSFEYKELRIDEYEDELLHAFAKGEGPDIYAVHNTWLGEYESLIEPLPSSLTIPYSETRGSIKKEKVYTIKQEPTISQRALKTNYIDIVAQDVIREYQPNAKEAAKEQIFGLPLSVDTLALYYNKDILNAASIAQPPTNWTQFQDAVTKLTRISANDTLLQSGAAIGTSKNTERAFDILSLLMMQNGTQMTDGRGHAIFAQENNETSPAGEAVRFYTDFANPQKAVYSWNEDQTGSFDAFVNGNAAFFLGYSYHNPLIRAANSKLNYAIAPVPQIENGRTVNFANYWVQTVAKSTKNKDWAWDFVQFCADKEQVAKYLETAQKPTALRSLINTQIEDEVLSIFVGQSLTAQSWYKGKDAQAAEEAFLDLIDDFLRGNDPQNSLREAQNKLNQTL
jgi:multiple sugar transport system substrate-binding protein